MSLWEMIKPLAMVGSGTFLTLQRLLLQGPTCSPLQRPDVLHTHFLTNSPTSCPNMILKKLGSMNSQHRRSGLPGKTCEVNVSGCDLEVFCFPEERGEGLNLHFAPAAFFQRLQLWMTPATLKMTFTSQSLCL